MAGTLDRELDTFRRELPNLLADPANRGQFARSGARAVAGVYPTFDAVLAAGYDRFGLDPFLVKEVTENREVPRYFFAQPAMPLLTGPLTPGGAIIDVLVGVSRPRLALLLKHQFPVPVPVHVRAVIDTGASVSGFAHVSAARSDPGRASFHPDPVHPGRRPTRGRPVRRVAVPGG